MITSPSSEARTSPTPVRVMVVDDSAVIRGLVARILEAAGDVEVVATAGNGRMALSALQRQPVDVVVLDIEMPEMDGLAALPELLRLRPGLKVLMASTLTRHNAEISLKALDLGAADYVPKPTATRDIHGGVEFKDELVAKVRTLGRLAQAQAGPAARAALKPIERPSLAALQPARTGSLALRPMPALPPEVIAIGSSTGGPQALFRVLGDLKPGLRQPILITQHMPPTFTQILGEHIHRQTGLASAEARDGEPLAGGRIYIAPGDHHMVIARTTQGRVIRLNRDPPENFCRPSVDPMLRSLASVVGARVLAVILTGMGSDGTRGAQALVTAGGAVLAQDEATSVVWGMPGAVVTAGLASAILPLGEIGPTLKRLAG